MALIPGLRSVFFYIGYIPVIVIFSVLGVCLGVFMPNKQRQTLITTANALVIRWLKLSCGVRFHVTGIENIPSTPFVALSKHQSAWETFYLQRALRPVSTILKKELLKVPFFGWGLAMTRPIAIDRSNPRAALRDILSQGKIRLAQGNNVLLYPEGTRIDHGKSGRYGRSGAALAIATGVPILPIAHNAGVYWPARKFIKFPGTVQVVIGKPVSTDNKNAKQLTEEIEQWIESNV